MLNKVGFGMRGRSSESATNIIQKKRKTVWLSLQSERQFQIKCRATQSSVNAEVTKFVSPDSSVDFGYGFYLP
jgi:hypothetical protein